VDDRIVVLARELEAKDLRLGSAIDDVARLQEETESIRTSAAAVGERLAAAPEALTAAAGVVAAAEAESAAARSEATRAERAVVHAEERGTEGDVAAARRELTRARDRAASLDRRLERARAELVEVERDEADARLAVGLLEERATTVDDGLEAIGRGSTEAAPPRAPGIEGLLAWATRTRAALLVVRSGLDNERERVVREANELAAGVLGDPTVAASVPDVRRRIEAARSPERSARMGA
jgi:DNA repair exonuclease SbcCD ATPase subunit